MLGAPKPRTEEITTLDKAPDAFRTISEVAEDLKIPQHVLRFWESKFSQIRPMKRAGGRRYYRPDDVDLLRGIRHLLYEECYRIEGVKTILSEKGVKYAQLVWRSGGALPPSLAADAVPEESEQRAPDEVARMTFGPIQRVSEPPVGDPELDSSSEPVLTQDQARRLHGVLHELAECRRLIDDALKDEAA
jgi:DNA-binding transcriptional MerR regulator